METFPPGTVCKRCLLREMAQSGEIARTIQEYVENLEDEVRTPADLYEQRLQQCRQCDKLLSGMCMGCGCYVERRAALLAMHCPYEKW